MDKAKILPEFYIMCPAHVATGGTEALHALGQELLKHGVMAFMYYVNIDQKRAIVPNRFLRFAVPYVTHIIDAPNGVLIIPEIMTEVIGRFQKVQKFVWWLSVDNYIRPLRFCGPREMFNLLWERLLKRNVDFTDRRVVHLCQSYYALDFVRRNGGQGSLLMDYLGTEHLVPSGIDKHRGDIVLYNPAKGLRFTRKIIRALKSEGIRFIALKDMSPSAVHQWFLRAKVFIDFGNHPGKDRLPREAAMGGCIVITSRNGAAAFYEDIPIPDDYKYIAESRQLPKIKAMVRDCLLHYERHVKDFDAYRMIIKGDYARFSAQVKAIFLSSGE